MEQSVGVFKICISKIVVLFFVQISCAEKCYLKHQWQVGLRNETQQSEKLRSAYHLFQEGQAQLQGMPSLPYSFIRPVEFKETYMRQPGRYQQIGGISRESLARYSILHYI